MYAYLTPLLLFAEFTEVVFIVVTELLLPLLNILGFIMLSLLEDERLPATVLLSLAISISSKRRLTYSASGQHLAIFCIKAVVEDVLNRPNALRLKPWLRQVSTAPHSEVIELLSS